MRNDIAHKGTDAIIDKMERRLAKEYALAGDQVANKFDDYTRRFKLKDAKWQKWVENGTKSAEEYKKWKVGQVMMGKRWEEMKDTLAQDYVNTALKAESITNGYMAEVYALNHNYATFEIEKKGLVDTSYTLYSRESVERLMRDNGMLYKAPGKAVMEQVKDGTLKAWSKDQIQSVMLQGILQGESIPNLTKRLEKVTGGLHAAAIRNARTMTTGIQNAGRMDAIHRANEMGIPTKKTWLAVLDTRTRHWHRELDGVTIPEEEPFVNEYGYIMYPGDPEADGANVYNCRCTMTTSIEGNEIDWTNMDLRYNAGLGDMTYDEWLDEHGESQPITYQEDVGEAIRQSYISRYRNG